MSDKNELAGETKTIQRLEVSSEMRTEPFLLVVIEGPDTGKSFAIDGTEPGAVYVGQSAICPVRLSDPHVSRRHVSLDVSAHRLRLTDLGSTNGTFVDGVACVEVFLRGGEIVRMGQTALRIDRAEAAALDAELPLRLGRLTGHSPQMRRIYQLGERLARDGIGPILIEGESGTGKELLAEVLHELGPRAEGPFVVFDCTAIPTSRMEVELFGREKADEADALGALEQAQGGTLLLDEVAELDAKLQPRLLRAMERREMRRVGGSRPIPLDVRIMATARRSLDHDVQLGRVREDLFYELAGGRIELPPLRRREGDVAVLARHFWFELGGEEEALSGDFIQRLEDHSWPGNVRELRRVITRHFALSAGGASAVEDGPLGAAPEERASPRELQVAFHLPFTQARQKAIKDFEQAYVERVLADYGGNVSRAAAASGIARRYFQILRARRDRDP